MEISKHPNGSRRRHLSVAWRSSFRNFDKTAPKPVSSMRKKKISLPLLKRSSQYLYEELPKVIKTKILLSFYGHSDFYIPIRQKQREKGYGWVILHIARIKTTPGRCQTYLKHEYSASSKIKKVARLYHKLNQIEQAMGEVVSKHYLDDYLKEQKQQYHEFVADLCTRQQTALTSET